MSATLASPHPIAGIIRMRRVTVRRLAADVGCSDTYLSGVINGRYRPSRRMRAALSLALQLPSGELFGDEA